MPLGFICILHLGWTFFLFNIYVFIAQNLFLLSDYVWLPNLNVMKYMQNSIQP